MLLENLAATDLPLLTADHARQDEDGVSGLGLAMARSIGEAYRGVLRATSAGLGRGATFTVKLSIYRE